MEHFITQIKVEKLLHLSDICIELRPDVRTNLLLTGKNGSGKTTVLQGIKKYLKAIADNQLQLIESHYPKLINYANDNIRNAVNENEKYSAEQDYQTYLNMLKQYKDGIYTEFNNQDGLDGLFMDGKFILAYYRADRQIRIIRQKSVEDVVLEKRYSLESNPGQVLLKYLVHLKTQQAYARNENDIEIVEKIEKWFERFSGALKVLLDDQNMELKYDYKNYNFEIIEEGRNPFGFDQLSDGYSAAIQIVADLILRMEQNWLKRGELSSYDAEGIVLIDELETHLHIGLQKTILPFLTSFFPRIQFIVSTHSPYILNSIENCVVYDLEKRIRMEDMSGYSAEGIVEGYFDQDQYSKALMEKVRKYENLVENLNPTEEEQAERAKIRTELKKLSGDLSREARSAFEEIEDRRKQHDKV